jgi:pantoate--beta-alanine ligase
MIVTERISEIRKYRASQQAGHWGLVPTMGFLHAGHLSLVRRAMLENAHVGVSVFVNPIQFNDAKDLDDYPRDLQRDLQMLESEGVELVWTPTSEDVYPAGYQTYVEVREVSARLEGAVRPGHFRGVATIVAKLCNVFEPQRAYFGQKDAQQVAVLRRMVRDLDFPVAVVVCETVREPDGLAMSSRNSNLTPEARKQAVCLSQALASARSAYGQGERDAARLRKRMRATVRAFPLARLEYVSVAHPETLVELDEIADQALLSMAVFVDGVRLIDNMLL